MSTLNRLALYCFVAASVAACGGTTEPAYEAELRAPEPQRARVSLTPALDVSSLVDSNLADRILIDEIVVNLADARLLGANPGIPTAGMKLLGDERLLVNDGDGASSIEFPFPQAFLDDSLAIYVRIAPSQAIGGASVIVRARLFELPVSGTKTLDQAPDPDGDPAIEEDEEEAPDPDGDPAMQRGSAPDPDGDPAMGGGGLAPDPDGDPAMAHCASDGRCNAMNVKSMRRSLRKNLPSIPFELRGLDEADLVIGFDKDSNLNVVLGIPAARWFTNEAIQTLERALDEASQQEVDPSTGTTDTNRRRVIVSTEEKKVDDVRNENEDYSLQEREEIDPRSVRSR